MNRPFSPFFSSLALACLLLPSVAAARSNYVAFLPNGSAADGNGCINCHFSAQGSGPRNPFGEDVKNNKSFFLPSWPNVCALDSDGDGQTNGEEMGDPDCVWVHSLSGSPDPARTTDISNPGVASSTSTDPTGGGSGGGTDAGTGAPPAPPEPCPSYASYINGACACSAGYTMNNAGDTCEADAGETDAGPGAGGNDTGGNDTGGNDTGGNDTGGNDTGSADAGPGDTGNGGDTGNVDAGSGADGNGDGTVNGGGTGNVDAGDNTGTGGNSASGGFGCAATGTANSAPFAMLGLLLAWRRRRRV